MIKAFVLLSSSIKKHRRHTSKHKRKKLGSGVSKGEKGNPIEIDTNERLKTLEIESTRKMLDFEDLDSDTPLNELKRSTEVVKKNIKKVLEKNIKKTVEKTVKEKKELEGKNDKRTTVLKMEKKEQQHYVVKEIGFARLLRFKMDRIPTKLAYYVVDQFNPED
ncbi:hypothetical protein L1987_22393 [Smallanthus sonchifolius]|uniref:Uncharacterized protein n=1 Tax=Smallanthus sonchifolius TaxID=185202 RepID=A0ACB9IG79_9ASTR|nr:hypothetical protein L1987_22393 [Smallanthus sonchifolius]